MAHWPHMSCVLLFACASSQAASTPAWVLAAQAELQQRLQAAYPDVSAWTLDPLLSERQLSLQGTEIDVTDVRTGKRSAVQVTWRDGDASSRQTVWFNVIGQQPALLAASDVKRNEALQEEILIADAQAEWAPDCRVVTSKAAVQGMRLRKALRAGEPICEQDMEPKPLVARGERVTVRARAGLVTVMLDGIAEQDGNLGDQLPIRNPTSGESYMAAVAAEGEVVVRE